VAVCALLRSSILALKSLMLSQPFPLSFPVESLATSTPRAKLAVESKLELTLRLSPSTACIDMLSATRLKVGDFFVGVSSTSRRCGERLELGESASGLGRKSAFPLGVASAEAWGL